MLDGMSLVIYKHCQYTMRHSSIPEARMVAKKMADEIFERNERFWAKYKAQGWEIPKEYQLRR